MDTDLDRPSRDVALGHLTCLRTSPERGTALVVLVNQVVPLQPFNAFAFELIGAVQFAKS